MPKLRLVRHREFDCGGKGAAFCSLCDYQTNSKSAFGMHMKFVHKKKAGPQTFSCGVCSEVFETQKAVNKHSMTHGGMRI